MDNEIYEEYIRSTQDVHTLSYTPSNDDLLTLYGLYKQITIGDNTTKKPNRLLRHRDYMKWSAWEKYRGMDKIDCMKSYITKVAELQQL